MVLSQATSDHDVSTNRRIIIGDVHGHYDGLIQLLDLIQVGDDTTVYFLGDLVDRGPKSAQVVDLVMSHDYHCLRGNHEELMINACNKEDHDYMAFNMWVACGGRQTLESYESSEQLQTHLEWMKQLPSYLDLGDLWLVHAGVNPKMKLSRQTNEEFCWIRGVFHRARVPFFEDKLIITGHTITFTFPNVKVGQVAQGPGWIDIDTGAYHPKSGWLTAFDSQSKQVYQVNVYTRDSRITDWADAIAPINPKKIKAQL